jgi:hypothetical protein
VSIYPTSASDARCAARGCRCGSRWPVYPSDMSDAEWEVLQAEATGVMAQTRLAPGRPMDHPLRSMLDAVRYVVRNGIEWRALPVDLGQVVPGRPASPSGREGADLPAGIEDLGRRHRGSLVAG